ncbi:hypothetical protein H5410_004591 [Solanum commersonii]|uniref:Uncharacterized protein n=1 Tax=Solanum commersonii TaxID=4109 RepID=A0A9J6B8F6_SOLCO|nr:hypothetical protein H5410_004591 [Solanum commersonii]
MFIKDNNFIEALGYIIVVELVGDKNNGVPNNSTSQFSVLAEKKFWGRKKSYLSELEIDEKMITALELLIKK